MNNQSFNQKRIAQGYAKDRPFLHRQVIEQLKEDIHLKEPFEYGLDVGCGAGLSMQALKMICKQVRGTDISGEMIACCKENIKEPGYNFVCSRAEEVQAKEDTFDIVTAAGVINWVEEEEFLGNLKNIMCNHSLLFIYDFWITGKMTDCPAYSEWWEKQYLKNFPKPHRKETTWSSQELPEYFIMEKQTTYELQHTFTLGSFIRFMMIQSNVNVQIEAGEKNEEEVKSWFYHTLESVWGEKETQQLVFDGYGWYIRLEK